ncbi:hypothetical protein, partial [Sinomonas soli]
MSNLADFLAEEAINVAYAAGQVGVITKHTTVAFNTIMEAGGSFIESFSKVNGAERISIGEGDIRFFNPERSGRVRGSSFSLILVDLGTCDQDVIREAAPALASTGGNLVGYY